jgi:hypothetical protein
MMGKRLLVDAAIILGGVLFGILLGLAVGAVAHP